MKVLVRREDESVLVHIDGDYFGLAYDELADPFDDHGLHGGVSTVAEVTLSEEVAAELRDALAKELAK